MQRFLTAILLTPLVLVALFFLPHWGFFIFAAAVISLAAWEYVGIVRPQAPKAPLRALLVLVPLAALAMSWSLTSNPAAEPT